jgi:hypothetical protein
MERARKLSDYVAETFVALVYVVNELQHANDKGDSSCIENKKEEKLVE